MATPNDFNARDFMCNLVELTSQPDNVDPQAITHLLQQTTGMTFVRVEGEPSSTSRGASSNPEPSRLLPSSPAPAPHPATGTNLAEIATGTATTTTTAPEIEQQQEQHYGNDDEEDDSDFLSCCNSSFEEDGLFDHSDLERFPQGTLCYTVNNGKFSPSWCMLQYSWKSGKGKNKEQRYFHHSCLGIYKCPHAGCNFVSNPVHPTNRKKKYALPDKAKGSQLCTKHNCNLVHVACNATMILRRTPDTTTVEHVGVHDHPRPHETKPSAKSQQWLEEVVNANTKAVANEIGAGTPTRKPAGDIHPSYQNQDRLGYEMKKFKNKMNSFKLSDLPKMEEIMGSKYKFLKRADLSENGIISIQYPAMEDIAKKNGGTAQRQEGEVSYDLVTTSF